MKISRYSIFLEADDACYVYNTLSNAFIEIEDKEFYTRLLSSKEHGTEVEESDYESDFYGMLKDNMIVTESDEDNYLLYKSIILEQRAQRGSMHLTLAPTMDCCFRCHYCFEKYKEKLYMTPEIMDAIIKYVMSCEMLKYMRVTWFGGEPLMAIGQIEEFYDKLMAVWGDKEFDSNIITTGYHIDDNVIRVLKKVRVSSMQITLDGMRETHNKVKNFPGCDDVFERVLTNIEHLNDEFPELHVVIRVNLTHDNAHEYVELYKLLSERFKGRRNIAPAPAFVMDRGGCFDKSNDMRLFGPRENSEYILKLAHDNYDSPYIRYPKPFFTECAIRNNVAIAFDPEGYAYKCWEMIGNKEYAIGRLDSEGRLTDVNVKVLNRQLYGADPLDDPTCRKCRYLPICGGGCPIQRIENEFEGGRNNCCTHYKGYMEEFLKEHIRRKKMGLDNR